MEIFYIEIEKFKKQHNKTFLEQYDDIGCKNEKRFFEYTIGRYLVKTVAKKIYNIENTDIVFNNNKPVFKNEKLNFNISHSKNIVLACFDNFPCGIDIEYIKERNLEKLSKYFKCNFKNSEDFYKFWTLKEAKYKLSDEIKSIYSKKFKDKYYITALSSAETEFKISEFDMQKVWFTGFKCLSTKIR